MDSCLRRLHEAITSATAGMSTEQLMSHASGTWSPAEVLEHLLLTYSGTVKGLERCLQLGKPMGRAPTLKQRLRTAVVLGLSYMPSGRKAPERAMPHGMPVEDVLGSIGPELIKLDSVIEQCKTRFGKRTRVLDHPTLGPMTAWQWRKFHWVHGRHHMEQVKRLREGG